jgi:hypothetical protein
LKINKYCYLLHLVGLDLITLPVGDSSSATGKGAGWVGRAVQPSGQAEFKGQQNEYCALQILSFLNRF